jgi:hypothetical protein
LGTGFPSFRLSKKGKLPSFGVNLASLFAA